MINPLACYFHHCRVLDPAMGDLQESPVTCRSSVLHQHLGNITQARTRPAKQVFGLLTSLR